MCEVAKIKIAIFKHLGDNLSFHAGVFDYPGNIVCVKLLCNDVAEVHSHFERVLTEHDIDTLTAEREQDEQKRRDAEEADEKEIEQITKEDLPENSRGQNLTTGTFRVQHLR